MSDEIRVVIIDDHPLFREGVAKTLQVRLDMEIVGQGSPAKDELRLAKSLLPDIILLDIAMPGALSKSRPPRSSLDELTDRERQILELVVTGFSNKEIGHSNFAENDFGGGKWTLEKKQIQRES